MLQYLINTTAIWLLSLLVFDIALRGQPMHGYNRFYLLATLIAGVLLPLVPLGSSGFAYQPLLVPATRVAPVVSAVNQVAAEANDTNQSAPWLLIIYLLGISASITVLALEVVKLVRLSSHSHTSTDGNWTIIETGKEHSPFSLMNRLYVTRRQQYTDTEWQMILSHEGRHTHLLHFADLLLLHMARIIFWFHPLVYIYHRRLLMVHEYQADANASEPTIYGRFLVEQAMFHAAPTVTHSLNYSPIKNRISMLTKNKTKFQPLKMAVILPLLAVATGCFTKEATKRSFERNGNEITYNGNKFKMAEPKTDTFELEDPITGEHLTQIAVLNPKPLEMNGMKIYSVDEAAVPEYAAGNSTLEELVMKAVSQNLPPLPDGDYNIDLTNVVLDENGKVAFYELKGFKHSDYSNLNFVTNDTAEKIALLIDNTLNDAPALKPAMLKGAKVPYLMQTSFWRPVITVKGSKVTYANPPNVSHSN